VLVDYSDQRGHSPVLPLQVRIDALARRVAFFCRELNLCTIEASFQERFVLESWLLLIYFDFIMRFRTFKTLHMVVRRHKVKSCSAMSRVSGEQLCRAVDIACVFYFKNVLCLQRSAATTLLLRRHGHKAEMVIGAGMFPPSFHAWVEIDNAVVNDKPYMSDIYQVLERC
jgi:hypothetical protein